MAKEPEKKPAPQAATNAAPPAASPAKPAAKEGVRLPAGGVQPLTVVSGQRQLSIIRFSPCGKFLIGAGLGPMVYRWDVSKTAAAKDEPPSLDAALDGKKKKPAPAPAKVYAEMPELPPLDGHRGWITGLDLVADGERVITGDSWGRLLCRSYLGAKPATLWTIDEAHAGWVRQVAVGPDGKTFATCGADGKVVLRSTADGKPLHTWTDHEADVYSVAFHPDGKSLVSGDIHGTIIHWDLATKKPVRRFAAEVLYLAEDDTLQDVGGVRRLVFDADAKTLVACGGKPAGGGFVVATAVMRSFDWKTGKTIATHEPGDSKSGFVHDAVFHPDGYLIGTTSGQPGSGQFFLWRLSDEKPQFIYTKMANCQSVALHPDRTRVAVAYTNGDSAGNGRRMKSDEDYHGNTSPISVWDATQLKT
jgi:WD40 repeat protein